MPGSSRVPVSLSNLSSYTKAAARRNPNAVFNFDLLRNIIFALFVLRHFRKAIRQLRGRGILGTLASFYRYLQRVAYGVFLGLPWIRSKVQGQIDEALKKLEDRLVPKGPGVTRYTTLPKDGLDNDKIKEILKELSELHHAEWEKGQVSGAVYHGGKEMLDLQSEAYRMFAVSNPLHPDVFPGVRKMEAEVVAMVLAMYNAPLGAAGITTSGGTESILMACLAARAKAYEERGVTEPEMVVPTTVHAAFDKAGHYFNIKVHHVDVDPVTLKVNLKAVNRLVNYNTILIVGSAPNFPHGIIDDITGLSKIALRKRVPLHVDACLGSFLVPFLEKAGYETEPFDFRIKGVTSISCDTHKYGFAPKGNSVLLFRTRKLRQYGYFITATWPGGVYASPTLAGSRAGSLIAGTWTALMKIGEGGYISSCRSIVGAAKAIETGIREKLHPDLYIMGEPLVSVVSFSSKTLNIYELADEMNSLGWHLNALQSPPALHIACTRPTVEAVDKFLTDLEAAVQTVKQKGSDAAPGNTAALYGVAGSLPNKSVIKKMATGFIDTLYKA
ncbi:pyridoxal phosphate-dependent transferase [Tricharina praecox]|uniref:pyridoxal phosphate-dependent transferase n=1 Tax=Tricharina praecox TaxID=43433 RepID=UPI00221FD269|nr:pyridoxal phosphate-dependent transferase [Tricharina praecox]KAI5850910.1 pyridoxal phosphate-dependent transferase [Tricharina praecox]